MKTPKKNKKTTFPNDRFFRGYIGKPGNTKKLLQWKLPAEVRKPLDWRTMKLRSTTFVDERLRKKESDLLVEFRTKGNEPVFVYVLCEHQSRIDPLMAWRLFCYRMEIWKMWQLENPNNRRFPFIYAIVLYQGKQVWDASTNFADMIDLSALGLDDFPEGQRTDNQYSVISLIGMKKRELPEDLTLRLGLTLMQSVTLNNQTNWLAHHGEELNEILSKPGGNVSFEMVIEYIFITEEDEKKVLKALAKTTPLVETQAMSVADQLEKRGEERGEKRGLERGRKDVIESMLKNGATPEQVAELTGIKLPEIEKIAEAIDQG